MSMRVLCIVGARPNFMKVAPILAALRAAEHEGVLVHTGQHYDDAMSEAFFRDLGLPSPDYHLGVGSGTHAQQTARVMESFEPVLREVLPNWVLVVGDVNSTLACALVSAKLRSELGCRVVHVEAGLRSGNWNMPEEINRVLTDRLSDLLATPSRGAHENLLAEGITSERVVFVGNVMIDTLMSQLPYSRELNIHERLGIARGEYVLTTLHRPSNVDDPEVLRTILVALGRIAAEHTVVFPIHPRTRKRVIESGLKELLEPMLILDPVGYRRMLALTDGARCVLTDSGGVQEETTALGVPCLTLREETERPITITQGTNQLSAWPLSIDGISESFQQILARGSVRASERPEGWDGMAAERLVAALVHPIAGVY
jgi:UDP-N-acetylglucosamine 2-epimerase (non-hydrolysing)